MFYNFLPDLSGSSIRSAGLVSGQVANGMKIVAISSPFQPGFGDDSVDEYNGVTIYRAYQSDNPLIGEMGSSIWTRLKKVALFPHFVRFIRTVSKREQAAIIHAHSTFYCALAAYVAARSLRLKVVYEFRSLWEERSRDIGTIYRIQARVSRWFETISLRIVDRVVAINEALKQEVVSRGVPPERVYVVPNAVDDELIGYGVQCRPPNKVLRFGYIGNFSSIEGLDLLVAAFRKAFEAEEDVKLYFHGTGSYERDLRRIVQEADDPRIHICGSFARNEIKSVYDTVDCIVLPRHRSKLNDTVTPLKPLEAMAFKRLVGVSDARGLLEVIGDRSNAWVFPADDVDGLAAALRRVYLGEINVEEMAARGYEFVRNHRNWNAIAAKYSEVYASC